MVMVATSIRKSLVCVVYREDRAKFIHAIHIWRFESRERKRIL